eukprot:snap_masked-scaffold_20-processed-gene-3.10-mRNA-1 protein AED:1.00 eAED:1.00 QI:0/-1/0/0/-1/1/1/0/79
MKINVSLLRMSKQKLSKPPGVIEQGELLNAMSSKSRNIQEIQQKLRALDDVLKTSKSRISTHKPTLNYHIQRLAKRAME